MKTAIVTSLLLLWILPGPDFAQAVNLHWDSPVKERYVTFYAEPQGKPPEEMAYLIEPLNPDPAFQAEWEREAQTNRNLIPKIHRNDREIFDNESKAVWVPFKTNLNVDLGPGDGGRTFWVSYRNKNDNGVSWDGTTIAVQSSPPFICITDPKERVISQPMIQLKGFTSTDLEYPLHYQILNQNGSVTASGDGIVMNKYFDKILWANTTNYFQCYDLYLSPGTNTIVIHTMDHIGSSITTNFTCVFTTAGVVNGPSLKQVWPEDGNSISASDFTMDGISDDPTAHIVALVVTPEVETLQKEAEVERNGRYWVDNLPLSEGRTYVTLIANNAAGYTTITNLSVRKSHYQLAMDPVVPADKLWRPYLTITGTSSLSPSNYTIWVNEVKATMDSNGKWKADNVPVTEGGVASFTMKAVPNSGHDEEDEPDPYPTVPIIWSDATSEIKSGVYLAPGDTNHFNHYRCDFYLSNVSSTNMSFQWILPKQELVCSSILYDTDGKEVPKSQKSQPLAANLDIHHLDAKAIEQIDGVLPLASNMPVRVGLINVVDEFAIGSPGNYRMQVRGRLYQITETGKLMPVELAPVWIPVNIADQPSEMVFYLNDLERQGKLVWGLPMKSLRVGVAHDVGPRTGGKDYEIEVFLQNTGTNDFHNSNLRMPNPNEQCGVSLYDSSGKEVPKTTLGGQQGQPLSLDGQNPTKTPGVMDEINTMLGFGNVRRPRALRPVFFPTKDAIEFGRFNLYDYFEIKLPGKYQFTYQQRLYKWNTNSTLTGMTFPTVSVPIEIH